MRNRKGLTLLEIIIILAFAISLLITFLIQKNNLEATSRDSIRKTAINTIYYALEQSFYKEHGYYPEYITAENLVVVDPALFNDPSGFTLGDPQSSYIYRPANCVLNQCQEFILSTSLEKEDTYTKYSTPHD